MLNYVIKTLIIFSLSLQISFAADIPKLKNLFIDNFDNYYQPRFCGKNTARFISEAVKRNIDLSNSYVLKIVGAGFLETSGFYTRAGINQREMLGYFHMVFVADNYVFDFDLDEPIVLKLEEYIRLQFTPPYEPFNIWGINYESKDQLSSWKATRYEWPNYIQGKEVKVWEKNFPDFININKMLELKRAR